jgi:hypothetical protein
LTTAGVRRNKREAQLEEDMKTAVVMMVVASVGVAIGAWVVSRQLNSRRDAEFAARQAAWQSEKAELEAALEDARSRARNAMIPVMASPVVSNAPAKLSPAEIIAQLVSLKSVSANNPRTMRKAIYWLEELAAAGPAALPAIRQFLSRNEEIDFVSAPTSRGRGTSTESVAPVSLRFGLFEVVRQIGGPEAESVLAEILGTTGRGIEVAWLARTLQEMAPNKYRDAALAAARELLGRATTPQNGIDRDERDQLFSVLTMYGDNSYVSNAQAQLLRATGEIDRGALKYLQQTLGPQSVAIAAQLYDDPRLKGPENKEPLARLALTYVGVDGQANQFYEKTINDLTLTKGHRSNLIEDLNEDGLNFRNLTARDLPIIENRISLIEQLAPHAADAVNAAAFKEAYKDLVNMREKASRQAGP